MNIKGSRFFLSPAEVHFTQDSVAMCFQNENELNKTCEEIAKNNMSAAEFPNIRVLDENGKYFSVDNRRLYVFRVLNLLGKLNWIQVKKVNQFDRERTTQNNGCHVFVRNRKVNNRWVKQETYRHCSCVEGRGMPRPSWWNISLKCHVSLVNVRLQRPIHVSSRIKNQPSVHQSNTRPVKTAVASSSNRPITNPTNNRNVGASVNIQKVRVSSYNPNTEIYRQPIQQQPRIRSERSSHNETAVSIENSDNCFESCIKKLFCCCF